MKNSRNTISVSENRCENIDVVTKQTCNRQLMIENGREFCFRCEEIAKEDLVFKEESEAIIQNREVNEIMRFFKAESLINKDLEDATFENYIPETASQKEALKVAQDYVSEFDKTSGLVLAGRTGVGKSHLSVAISKEIIQKKYSCLFISIPKLMTLIKSTYNRNSERTELDILRLIEKVDLLIFDDLGAERADATDEGTEWSKKKIFDITDGRAGRSTIFTSNYSGSELMQMYGERDFGRMVKDCKAITVTGENFRLKKFKKGAM